MPKSEKFFKYIGMNKIKINKTLLCLAGLGIILSVSFCFLSCESNFQGGEENSVQLKVMNWNLQTFFDSTFDGNEYSEYKNSKSGWSREKYEIRLERLASVIKKLDADLIVLEEIEKESQLQDIANRLSGSFDFSRLYSHAIFSGSEQSSIGCAVLSRYPLEQISVHTMDMRIAEKQPSMRPILQLTVCAKERNLLLFVNHWKSKSSGAEKSEFWRKRQERLLADLIIKAKKQNQAVLACGDFNKDISEFDCQSMPGEKAGIILHGSEETKVYSPWILENGTYKEPGSYWYKNQWERIDHFFCAGQIKIKDFCAENEGEWADSEGHPLRYQIWNGKGFSDHLPITCTVEF